MNIANIGGLAGAAGTQLAQAKAAESERARDANQQDRVRAGQDRAESAAGLGAAEEDQGVSDRDADGRRLWEEPARKKTKGKETPPPPIEAPADPKGECGTQLDLTG